MGELTTSFIPVDIHPYPGSPSTDFIRATADRSHVVLDTYTCARTRPFLGRIEVCRLLAPHLPAKIIPVSKEVLVTLWLLGNIESFRGVADRFDLGKSSLHRVLFQVCNALKAIRGTLIAWPTRDQLPQLADDFFRRTNMPGVIGAIDGTHIPIPGPSHERQAYINRKGFPSIQLQAVCDAKLRFINILTGWPGSVHDARVFRNSPLYTLLENGNFPEDYHLLGDSAYTLQPYMLVSYRDNGHLLPWQVNFNHIHSTSRVIMERAFGLLKSKFRRLQKLEMIDVERIPLVIAGACVMHNIILMKENLNLDLEIQQDLKVIGHDVGDDNVAARQIHAAAVQKRDEIATGLAMHM
ncbi:putative nuclease HARBI1 [Portunus trituberculatus]|uniref:putative nuclease HARBI1 n=1 Tax=Portunus trituberculatus TaxID=210409 RepID=UPI001E1CF0D4|nr:putative nuclease HARBI1 [Portunus trituberculatus]